MCLLIVYQSIFGICYSMYFLNNQDITMMPWLTTHRAISREHRESDDSKVKVHTVNIESIKVSKNLRGSPNTPIFHTRKLRPRMVKLFLPIIV